LYTFPSFCIIVCGHKGLPEGRGGVNIVVMVIQVALDTTWENTGEGAEMGNSGRSGNRRKMMSPETAFLESLRPLQLGGGLDTILIGSSGFW
jgi:hypothetical protein